MEKEAIKNIISRLAKLEKAVFGEKTGQIERAKNKKFVGPIGGLRLSISKKFFDEKRGLNDTKNDLARNGYYYSIQAVQMALSRLSKAGGPLVSFKENGKKVYVKRK
jgi:hypothetical protein